MIVVDDFFDNPELEKAKALVAAYQNYEVNGKTYPHFAMTSDPKSIDKIKQITSLNLAPKLPTLYRAYFPDTPQPTLIHQDSAECDVAAVVFLNTVNTENGLAFWSPKGLKTPTLEDGLDVTKFKFIHHVEAKFNRAVIFDGQDYHSRWPKDGWVVEPNTPRLVKLFFLKKVL
jgi:hypothetical protein